MAEVWGLSQGTRDQRCRIIRRLLKAQFGARPIDPGSISPAVIRNFVLSDSSWSTSTIRFAAGAIRCYLRYRELLGDKVANLLRAVPRPAFWRDASLPEALSANELQCLFGAFDAPCPSRRRGYAMFRCLADLGLRCGEVVRLRLDDIDWQAGTVRIAGRRDGPTFCRCPRRPARRSPIISCTSARRPLAAQFSCDMSRPWASRWDDALFSKRFTPPIDGSAGIALESISCDTPWRADCSTRERR